MTYFFETSVDFAKKLDEQDKLKQFRNKFYFGNSTIYLDGNSLGRLPKKTKSLLDDIVKNQWGTELIESWNKNWYTKSTKLGNKIAGIIGAGEGEVIVSDSTSVNLYKLAYAALKYQVGKTRIVSDSFNFPSDLYILQGLIDRFKNSIELVLASSSDDISINTEDLKKKINKKTALVVLSLVAFKNAFMYNMEEVTKWAHKQGALILWDLSHAVGAVPIELNKTNADLAIGCTYKYLNGGPGAPAFLYIKKEIQEKLSSPIQGWFGDEHPFTFDLQYTPAKGIRKFLAGTPPVISQLLMEPGIDLILEAGMDNIRRKSIHQTEYFIYLFNHFLTDLGFTLGSPKNANQRGSHISLKHKEAYRISKSLISPANKEVKIIPDFRESDNIRFGITPLYTTFQELWETIQRLRNIVLTKEFEKHSIIRNAVT